MTIRPVAEQDWARVGQLAELLVEMHHAIDPSRFFHPDTLRGGDYVARVRAELGRGRAAVYVADRDGRVVGYVFAGIEAESWKELRHEAGYVHDIVVDPGERRGGIGRTLLASALGWFRDRGVARVILWSAYGNSDAQRLFRNVGFRPTMIEMTLGRDSETRDS